MRSLRGLYEDMESIEMMEFTLFYLHVEYDLVSYKEAALKDKWRKFMNNEINSIRRKDAWQLTTMSKIQYCAKQHGENHHH